MVIPHVGTKPKISFLFLGMNLTSQLLRCKMTPSILGLGEGVSNCLLHFISILNPVGGVIQFSQHIKFDTARWNMQTDRDHSIKILKSYTKIFLHIIAFRNIEKNVHYIDVTITLSTGYHAMATCNYLWSVF